MRKIKWLGAFLLPLLLVSFLQSQSLADLAKKEKARRAALKGKRAHVVTTADLAKVKKRPAVELVIQEEAVKETAAEGEEIAVEGQEAVTPPATVEEGKEVEAAETAAEPPKPVEETPPAEAAALSEKEFLAKQADLMKALEEKQDMVDLLTLKLNALYQEFNNLDTMKSRELVQSQIGITYDKLLKAEAEANSASKELDEFNAKTKRESVQTLWIR